MTNIYDHAYSLEKAIRESDEFQRLKAAYTNVMDDPQSRKTFISFRDTQLELQEKQMQGLEVSEEELNRAREIVESVQKDETIAKLMEEEQRLNVIIGDISSIITKPLEEVYGFNNKIDKKPES